jgi:hypothetical protein
MIAFVLGPLTISDLKDIPSSVQDMKIGWQTGMTSLLHKPNAF